MTDAMYVELVRRGGTRGVMVEYERVAWRPGWYGAVLRWDRVPEGCPECHHAVGDLLPGLPEWSLRTLTLRDSGWEFEETVADSREGLDVPGEAWVGARAGWDVPMRSADVMLGA